jgi:L-rhamnose isomerase/sugar isomerase
MDSSTSDKVFAALEMLRIELPSWGFANTGTRFGKFIQPAAATTTEEKFSDAGQVHLLTGVCPTVALHVLWDCPEGVQSTDEIKLYASRHGVLSGSINPNLFQDQEYKYGSFGNPDDPVRQRALRHTKESIEIAHRLKEQRHLFLVCGWVKLSRDRQYPATQTKVRRSFKRSAPGFVTRPENAGRVQASRTGLLSH